MGRMHVLMELEMASLEKTARCAGGAVRRSRTRRVGTGVGRLGRGSCGPGRRAPGTRPTWAAPRAS